MTANHSVMDASAMRRVHKAVVHVDCLDNDVIVRTLAGAARSVARAVDVAQWPGVLGTIAGNDSLLIVCDTPQRAAQLCDEFPQGICSDGNLVRLVDFPDPQGESSPHGDDVE